MFTQGFYWHSFARRALIHCKKFFTADSAIKRGHFMLSSISFFFSGLATPLHLASDELILLSSVPAGMVAIFIVYFPSSALLSRYSPAAEPSPGRGSPTLPDLVAKCLARLLVPNINISLSFSAVIAKRNPFLIPSVRS